MRVAAAQNTAAVSSIGGGPSSGATFLTQAIQGIAERIATRTRLGEPQRTELVVVDIDNTILDSRYRTLEALQRFGRAQNIPELRDLALNDVRIDGASTVAHLELDAKYLGLGKAVQAAWMRFFWDPNNLQYDQPIPGVMQWLTRAADAGAQVIYLTGRDDRLRDKTIEKLRLCGAPNSDVTHVRTKTPGVDTATFKRTALHQLCASASVAFFMSDSRRELAFASILDGLPLVRVAFPIETDCTPLPPGIPVLT